MKATALFVGCAISATVVGCGRWDAPEEEERTAVATQAVTATASLKFSLPQQVPITETALSASSALRLSDRVKIVASNQVPYIASTGSSETNIGADAQTRHVVSVGSVFLRERARVDGNVLTAGAIGAQNGVVVTGSRQPNATLTPVFEFSRSITFAGGGDVWREPNLGTVSLPPGNYGSVTVRSGSGLKLSAGTYFFESMTFDPQATLAVAPSTAPVIVYVHNVFDFKGNFANSGSAGDVFIGVLGTGTTSLEAALSATVAVPNGVLRFAPANKTFQGSFFGKEIQVEPDLTIKQIPFAHWGVIFQIKPVIECVSLFKPGYALGVFGYENLSNVAIPIKKGWNNQLVPAADVALPETFLPGRYKAQVMAPFYGSSVVWKLAGSSAKADAGVRRCDLSDYPLETTVQPHLQVQSRPSPAAISNLVADNYTHIRVENGVLPWGGSTGTTPITLAPSGTRTVQGLSPAGASAATTSFKIRFTSITVPDGDVGGQQEPILQRSSINGTNIPANTGGRATPIDLPDCNENSTCGITDQFAADVPASLSPVPVSVQISEDDDAGNNNDVELILELWVDNITGQATGKATSPDPYEVRNVAPGEHCASVQGWGLCWVVETNGAPRVCGAFHGSYVDSGQGEDEFNAVGMQAIPSSFARAHLELNNSAIGDTVSWDGVLDADGCIPMDNTPSTAYWQLGLTAQVTARFEVSTQLCYDPTGAGCYQADGITEQGARFFVQDRAVDPVGVATQCVIITTDEALTEPSTCRVIHASEGAFSAWRTSSSLVLIPPARLELYGPAEETASTRIAAAVSHWLAKEAASPGLFGIEDALITRQSAEGNATILYANQGYAQTDDAGGVLDRGTGFSMEDGNIYITPDLTCTAAKYLDCYTDPQAGTYVPCNPGELGCLPGSSRYKYAVVHELGHLVMRRSGAGTFAEYGVIPGVPDLCTCKNVTVNTQHCMQSLQLPSSAQMEGLSDFYGALAWNDTAQSDCWLGYGKEFTHADGWIEPPPSKIDCGSPKRWRNTHCVSAPAYGGYGPLDFGTEIDWLGFFWNVTTQTTNKVPILDLMNIYRLACGDINAPCEGLDKVGWDIALSGATNPTNPPIPLRQAAIVHLPQAKRNYFEFLGNQYGVSRDSTALP